MNPLDLEIFAVSGTKCKRTLTFMLLFRATIGREGEEATFLRTALPWCVVEVLGKRVGRGEPVEFAWWLARCDDSSRRHCRPDSDVQSLALE